MERIEDILSGGSIAVLGHVKPDGDCIGSCLGLKNYIVKAVPGIRVDVYLEPFRKEFLFLQGAEAVYHDFTPRRDYDLCIVCDASDISRLGEGRAIFDAASHTANIDHHRTNTGYAETTYLRAEVGSTCEILYELMDEELIDKEIAACLYTGMVHDSGVFKYQSTTMRTMEIAGKLMATGIPFTEIIDGTFYRKSLVQTKVLGYALQKCCASAGGRLLSTYLTLEEMGRFGAAPLDLEGIVEQLRLVDGVEASLFLYELEPGVYKASMRSKDYMDVSKIAASFGGGGHVRAAGCTVAGKAEDEMRKILAQMEEEVKSHG